jgi:hypothetical protein
MPGAPASGVIGGRLVLAREFAAVFTKEVPLSEGFEIQ